MRALDVLLRAFVAQMWMKMSGEYQPGFEVVRSPPSVKAKTRKRHSN